MPIYDSNTTSSEDRLEVVLKDETSGNVAQIDLVGGVRRLKTDATVTVESSFGVDGFADTWFSLGDPDDCDGIGSAGDTIRIQIPAGCNPTEFPAIDYTYTITAGDVAAALPEIAVRDAIISELNLDGTFNPNWKAVAIRDNGIVVIQSRFRGEVGERTSWSVTPTGTTTVLLGWSDIQQRSKAVSISRDVDDARVGVLGISGTVNVLPGSIGARYDEFFVDGGGSRDQAVNGSGTPVTFEIPIDAEDDVFINQVRVYGGANGIKFGKYLSQNSPLINGVLIEVKSDNEDPFVFPLIKTTEDWKNYFSFPSGADFRIDIQAGGDQFLAIFQATVPFVLRKQGTFGAGNDDYIKITIQDNLSNITQQEALAEGFRREP